MTIMGVTAFRSNPNKPVGKQQKIALAGLRLGEQRQVDFALNKALL